MKIDRLLQIVILFINKKKLTAQQLADKFQVTKKTIRRDIDTLTLAGIPIYSEVGQNGGYFIHEDFILPREIFTRSEFELLNSLLSGLCNSMENQKLESIFNKIIATKDHNYERNRKILIDLNPWDQKKRISKTIQTIEAGISAYQIVQFTYYRPNSVPRERKVKPLRLILKGSSWYMKGYCTFVEDYRLFKLTRMENICLLDENFAPMEDNQDDKEYYTNWYGINKDNHIRLRFYQPIYGELDKIISPEEIKWTEPYFDYILNFERDDWLISLLLGFREHVEIFDEELKEKYLATINKINELYK